MTPTLPPSDARLDALRSLARTVRREFPEHSTSFPESPALQLARAKVDVDLDTIDEQGLIAAVAGFMALTVINDDRQWLEAWLLGQVPGSNLIEG